MSYEPTVWKDGDLVTSAKLNKMEQGITALLPSYFIIRRKYDDDVWTYDKTWNEAIDAFNAGKILAVEFKEDGDVKSINICKRIEYKVLTIVFDGGELFADDENSYLTLAD